MGDAAKRAEKNPSFLSTVTRGAFLSCSESASLGQPFEVWKTRMAANRAETTCQSARAIYAEAGVLGFWAGLAPKLLECSTKGAVLLVASDALQDGCTALGLSKGAAGFVAGAGGGVAQTSVMGPSTFLVTAAVTGRAQGVTIASTARKAWSERGIAGFYPGATAVAFRQGTTWASRMGFDALIRPRMALFFHGEPHAKLTTAQSVLCGIMAGIFSCWNHPFEVARVEGQARVAKGESPAGMATVLSYVYRDYGLRGLFQGLIPRMCFGVNQTLFMVTGAKLLKERWG